MFDKNGKEMLTGMTVRISGAFFKNDNGIYFIAHCPGDPSWSGRDLSLTKICRNGKISKTKGIAFWPLISFTNDRTKNMAAKAHNAEYAEIEVIGGIPTHDIEAHFRELAENQRQWLQREIWDFGEDSPVVKDDRERIAFYESIADRLKAERE